MADAMKPDKDGDMVQIPRWLAVGLFRYHVRQAENLEVEAAGARDTCRALRIALGPEESQ